MAATKKKGFMAALMAKDALRPAKPNEIDKQTAGHESQIVAPKPAQPVVIKRK